MYFRNMNIDPGNGTMFLMKRSMRNIPEQVRALIAEFTDQLHTHIHIRIRIHIHIHVHVRIRIDSHWFLEC